MSRLLKSVTLAALVFGTGEAMAAKPSGFAKSFNRTSVSQSGFTQSTTTARTLRSATLVGNGGAVTASQGLSGVGNKTKLVDRFRSSGTVFSGVASQAASSTTFIKKNAHSAGAGGQGGGTAQMDKKGKNDKKHNDCGPHDPHDDHHHHHHCKLPPWWPCWPPVVVVGPPIIIEGPPPVIDVEVLSVSFVEPGDPAKQLGPLYRLTFRNNAAPIGRPFYVGLIAAMGREIAKDALPSFEPVMGMGPGEVRTIDIRLPIGVNFMAKNADGMPIPFAMLHAMVDSHHELPEVDEKNNLMVMERLAIPAVPPMAAGPATPGVPPVVQQ